MPPGVGRALTGGRRDCARARAQDQQCGPAPGGMLVFRYE